MQTVIKELAQHLDLKKDAKINVVSIVVNYDVQYGFIIIRESK